VPDRACAITQTSVDEPVTERYLISPALYCELAIGRRYGVVMRKLFVVIAIVLGACGKTVGDRRELAARIAEELRAYDRAVAVEVTGAGNDELAIYSDACGALHAQTHILATSRIRKAGFRFITCGVRGWGRPEWMMQP
jgi:hypothetical protein